MTTPTHTDEKDLLERLREGDEMAFGSIFHTYYPTLCLFAEKMLGDLSKAEDVIEDVFLRLWKSPPEFNDLEHLKAHLYHVTRNASLNALKLEKRVGERQYTYFERSEHTDEGYLNEVTRAEAFLLLHQAIATLPRQAGHIITQTYIDGKSNQEVADEMGISINTVKAQKQRGLTLLRNKLSGDQLTLLLLFPWLQ